MYEFEQARFNNQESNINMFYELLFKYRSIILHFISPFVSLLLEVDILACYFLYSLETFSSFQNLHKYLKFRVLPPHVDVYLEF